MNTGDTSFAHNPLAASSPIAAALFGELRAILTTLGDLVAYGRCGFGREGDGLVGLDHWRRTRNALRAAEGLFRRLALGPATALAETLLARPARPARFHHEPDIGKEAVAQPDEKDDAKRRPERISPLPWQPIRLHEAAARSAPYGNQGASAAGSSASHRDPFGTLGLPLRAEMLRHAALVCAIENPERAIRRLALILVRRHRQQATRPNRPVPALPFPRRWGCSPTAWRGLHPGPPADAPPGPWRDLAALMSAQPGGGP